MYFNPRSPCGERPHPRCAVPCPAYCNPRSPCGERQAQCSQMLSTYRFQSTLPVRGTTAIRFDGGRWILISIHVPRAGNDRPNLGRLTSSAKFQSTFPVRGTTEDAGHLAAIVADFNPRSPCGERLTGITIPSSFILISIHVPRAGNDNVEADAAAYDAISIHVPRAGNDNIEGVELGRTDTFQSTFPVRGTTAKVDNICPTALCNFRNFQQHC